MKEILYQDKISIIIPCYQASKSIRRCLNSVFDQTYKNLEVIAIDDGSKDNTLNILNDIANEKNNLYVYHQDNRGVAFTRNRAIQLATGKYTVFLDSDDELEKHYCETLINNMINDTQLVYTRIKGYHYSDDFRFNSFRTVLKNSFTAEEFDFYFKNWFFHTLMGKMYLTQLIKKCYFQDGLRIGEDLLFNFNYFNLIKKIVILDYTGYNYINNCDSAVHKFDKMDFEIQKHLYTKSMEFSKNLYNITENITSIPNIFLSNVVGILNVCVTTEKYHIIKNFVNEVANDALFKEISKGYFVDSTKYEFEIFLLKHKQVLLLYYLGKLYNWRN